MKVHELIAILSKMPQNAEVGMIWDSSMRTFVNCVYETKNGEIALADFNDLVLDHWHWPKDYSPNEEVNYYWTPKE